VWIKADRWSSEELAVFDDLEQYKKGWGVVGFPGRKRIFFGRISLPAISGSQREERGSRCLQGSGTVVSSKSAGRGGGRGSDRLCGAFLGNF